MKEAGVDRRNGGSCIQVRKKGPAGQVREEFVFFVLVMEGVRYRDKDSVLRGGSLLGHMFIITKAEHSVDTNICRYLMLISQKNVSTVILILI